MKVVSLAAVLVWGLLLGCAGQHASHPRSEASVARRADPEEVSPEAASIPAATTSTSGRPLVAITRADWCPTCRQLEPVVRRVEEEFKGRATFVYLDLTDDDAQAKAEARASEAGIHDFYEANAGRTGVVAIFGRDRGAPVRVRSLDSEPYRRALQEAERTYVTSAGRDASPPQSGTRR